MRILFICHRFPFPPKRGGKIRPFNIIQHLAREHEVHVASLVRSQAEADEGRGLGAHCASHTHARVFDWLQTLRMVARIPTPAPSSFGFFYSGALAAGIRRLLAAQRFDLIFVHCSSVARYVAGVQGVAKILDFGDMDSQKWLEYARYKPLPLNLGYRLEGLKLEAEERRLAGMFDCCTATTRGEWETLKQLAAHCESDWFPNGVDSRFFTPATEGYDPDSLSFVGRMDYYPNQEGMLEFCQSTWPLILQRRPAMKLTIVGAEPPPAIRALGQIPGVTVTGTVPDVRPYVNRSALMVAPLNIARGTQNKLLEAMASGVPVLTSPVAAAGVDAVAGEHMLVARSPQEYCDAVLRVAGDPAERARLALAGRARMLSHHGWDTSMRRLDGIVERCLSAFSLKSAKEGLVS